MRPRSIKKAIRKLDIKNDSIYFDVGCSNGYLTQLVSDLIKAKKTTGWDHGDENLSTATSLYPKLSFQHIDLNTPCSISDKANFITCFETIEHVGNITEAINNIDNIVTDDGKVLYTVPIESGYIGAIKYLIKKHIFKYRIDEISKDKAVWKKYERSLYNRKDISKYRDQRDRWATHFGFDYRDFEKKLNLKYNKVNAWTSGTTRFFLIDKSLEL